MQRENRLGARLPKAQLLHPAELLREQRKTRSGLRLQISVERRSLWGVLDKSDRHLIANDCEVIAVLKYYSVKTPKPRMATPSTRPYNPQLNVTLFHPRCSPHEVTGPLESKHERRKRRSWFDSR